jgi:hypothetical protein
LVQACPVITGSCLPLKFDKQNFTDMKKILSIFTLMVVMFLMTNPLAAQSFEPGDPGGTPTGPPMGGGAPIGGGTFILLALGATYGGKKLYTLQKEEV